MIREEEKTKQAAEFVVQRTFNAPRALVWKAFTESNHLEKWWGPVGFKLTVLKINLRPGGTFHYSMQSKGFTMWGRFVYREIVVPEKIVYISSFSDENGGITRAPMLSTFPLEILNVVEFTEKDGKTLLTLKGTPINATEEDTKVFIDYFASMNKGFNGTFDQLEEYLTKI